MAYQHSQPRIPLPVYRAEGTSQVSVALVPVAPSDAASKDYVDNELDLCASCCDTYVPAITNLIGFQGGPAVATSMQYTKVKDIVTAQVSVQNLFTPIGGQNCAFQLSLPIPVAGGNFMTGAAIGKGVVTRLFAYKTDSGMVWTVPGTQRVIFGTWNTDNDNANAVWIELSFMYNCVTPV